ncbi:MAG TPA: hypothetical protein VNR51_06335, partial [Hyphomicrobium sp.]|nr:hypothetical protein [Hyphomicrobium sp.]
FALRMSNDRDQEIVTSAISDTGSGLLEFLPSLGQREALAFGDGVALPVRIKFDELPAGCLPRSTTARFTEHWQRSVGDEGFLEHVVEKWRTSDIGAGGDITGSAAFMAESYVPEREHSGEPAAHETQAAPRREPEAAPRAAHPSPAMATPHPAPQPQPQPQTHQPLRPSTIVRKDPNAPATNDEAHAEERDASPLKSLRDRLIQRQQR